MALTATTVSDTPTLANERWIDCPSTEHLLLSILGDIEAVAVLRACGVSEGALAEALRAHIANADSNRSRISSALASWWRGPRVETDRDVERVLTRALIHAHAVARSRVTSAHLLISLLAESDAPSARALREHGVTRHDVLNYVSHRIAKGADSAFPPRPGSPWIVCAVILHNDDYTPMEFVVHVLEAIFDKSREDAVRLMQEVHEVGSAECGVFAYDAALAKVAAVADLSRAQEFALRCVLAVKTTEKEGADAELLT